MTYGAEAVIPIKANFSTLRTSSFTSDSNVELLGKNLDLIDERREKEMVQLAYYHQKLKQGYDANVKLRLLAPGDLVLRLLDNLFKGFIPDLEAVKSAYPRDLSLKDGLGINHPHVIGLLLSFVLGGLGLRLGKFSLHFSP